MKRITLNGIVTLIKLLRLHISTLRCETELPLTQRHTERPMTGSFYSSPVGLRESKDTSEWFSIDLAMTRAAEQGGHKHIKLKREDRQLAWCKWKPEEQRLQEITIALTAATSTWSHLSAVFTQISYKKREIAELCKSRSLCTIGQHCIDSKWDALLLSQLLKLILWDAIFAHFLWPQWLLFSLTAHLPCQV